MAEIHKNNPDDLALRRRRLMVITRSPSAIHGEIPEENIAERDADDRTRNQRLNESEEFREPDQPA